MPKISDRKTLCFVILILLVICIVNSNHKSDIYNTKILFDFEEEKELDLFRWKCKTLFSLSEEYAKHGNKSLKIEFFPTQQVGFSTNQIYNDWSHLRTLEFTVFNPSTKTINIYLRISDNFTKGDPSKAFTKMLSIASGDNLIIVSIFEMCDSISRKLNARNIRGFYIFMREIPTRTILYFDYFRLI